MGLFDWFFGLLGALGLYEKKASILFLGLDNAGKTTLLRLMAGDHLAVHAPTVHPTNDEITVNGLKIKAFDVGGHEQARRIWSDYFGTVDAIVYLLDISDHERIKEANRELMQLLASDELNGVPFLVLGNKTDVPGSLDEQGVRERFSLKDFDGGGAAAAADAADPRKIRLFMCSLVRGEGYMDAFRWLASIL